MRPEHRPRQLNFDGIARPERQLHILGHAGQLAMQRIIVGGNYEKRIEQRTVRQRSA